MSTTFVESQVLETVNCCKCKVTFAMPETWMTHYRKTHEYFHCPAGHSQHFTGETEEERLRKQLAREQSRIEHRDAEIRDLNSRNDKLRHQRDGMKGAYRKVAVRVKNGVCPCCKRTFSCLAAHMKNMHPDFTSTPPETK
jgi:hypothetical protein